MFFLVAKSNSITGFVSWSIHPLANQSPCLWVRPSVRRFSNTANSDRFVNSRKIKKISAFLCDSLFSNVSMSTKDGASGLILKKRKQQTVLVFIDNNYYSN